MDVIQKARQYHRKIIEWQYKGKCTVYEYVKIKENGITKPKEIKTGIIDEPCHVAYISFPSAIQTETGATITQSIKLFIAPDLKIKENSKLVITQDKITQVYQNSGVPAVYSTHQEINLTLFRGVGIIGLDYTQLVQLQNRLENITIQDWTESILRELAARLLRKVKQRTPVITGTLRNNWTIGEIKKQEDKFQIEIINSKDYASYVEYGHRTPNHTGWIEGQFMLTISLEELQSEAPTIIEQRLKELLQE